MRARGRRAPQLPTQSRIPYSFFALVLGAQLLTTACQGDLDGVDDSASVGEDTGIEVAAQAALPAGVRELFPAPGATSVCPDPALRIGFASAPRLGSSGRVQVFRADQPGRAVASVDLASGNVSDNRGSLQLTRTRPAYVDGNALVFYLPYKALDYGQTYFVKVDAGATAGAASISDANAWRFTVAARAPSGSNLTVGLDGSSDFCSLQRALDAAGASGANIKMKRGTYHGIVNVTGKSNITISGEDRKGTLLVGTNNEKLNGGTAKRALISFDRSSNITIENLSIRNTTPQGGSQAEALRLQRCDKCIVREADIRSLQDTLLWDGRVYAENIYVEGNVDYVWGYGAVYFKNSEFKTVGRSGYLVQARNEPGKYGYVFVDSKLTADPGVSGMVLARIDVGEFPGSQVAFVDCQMGPHIAREGWVVTGNGGRGQLRFQEFQSKDLQGRPLNVSGRLSGSKQLSASEAQRLRDPAVVLGGWKPPQS